MSKKKCEPCGKSIPDDFQNLLCDDCYAIQAKENEDRKKQIIAEVKKSPDSAINDKNIPKTEPIQSKDVKKQPKPTLPSDFGIKDPNYKENLEMDDKEQILANLAQFIYTHDESKGRPGKMLWYPTKNMYTHIKNYCIQKITTHPQYPKHQWKPKIVDVGCGSGVGSNIMSLEADFVWGIDKNKWSIEFAKDCFTREKNGIYYSAQETFDEIDIMTENRELMKFDIVVAIEIIEHIYDTHLFLTQITNHFTKKDKKGNPIREWGTEFFISTPNRNSPKIKDDQPDNSYHVREWTGQEFYELLSSYFEEIKYLNNKGEPIQIDAKDDIIFAHCKYPKI